MSNDVNDLKFDLVNNFKIKFNVHVHTFYLLLIKHIILIYL